MPEFVAVEMDYVTCERTGREESYLAETIQQAVEHVLYTRRLVAPAWVGPTGLVVYGKRGPKEPVRGYVVRSSKITPFLPDTERIIANG